MIASLTSHEIEAAFLRHTTSPNQAQIDALLRKGVAPWSIAGEPRSGERAVRFGRVVFNGPCFEFDPAPDFDLPPGGEPAMVVLAFNGFGDVADLGAFRGDRIAAWLGAVAMLGRQNVLGARLEPALNVHCTAFNWLLAGRDGVVLIDHKRAARQLWDRGPFRAADIEHARRLQSLLTPAAPSVVLTVPERRAA